MLKLDFNTRAQMLRSIGAEFHQTNKFESYEKPDANGRQGEYKEQPWFDKVLIPLSPDEWCSLCMCDGDNYIGCCGDSSHMQDTANHIFREGGWVEGKQLNELAEGSRAHDTDGAFRVKFDKGVLRDHESFATLGVWDKIAHVWRLIDGMYNADDVHAKSDRMDPMDRNFDLLASGFRTMSYHRLFARISDPLSNDALESQRTSQDKVSRMLWLSRVLPPLRDFQNRLSEFVPSHIDGWALVEKGKEGLDAVCSNGMGLCVYETEEQIQAFVSFLKECEAKKSEHQQLNKPWDEVFEIRKVRVTSENGIEFA